MQLCPRAVREGEESQEISVPRDSGAIPVPSTGANLCDGMHLCNSKDGHSARTIDHHPETSSLSGQAPTHKVQQLHEGGEGMAPGGSVQAGLRILCNTLRHCSPTLTWGGYA